MSIVFHAVWLAGMLALGSNFLTHVPVAALAGVTAWMGLTLLEWSTWRRLPKMRRVDGAAFLVTAVAVLVVNAVIAVVLDCAIFIGDWLIRRYLQSGSPVTSLETDSGETA